MGSPKPVSASMMAGRLVTRAMARPRWATSLRVVRPTSGRARSADRTAPETYTPSKPWRSISSETSGEKAPGNRSSLPVCRAARNSVRFWEADLEVKSMSENAALIAGGASKFLCGEREVEGAKFGSQEVRQSLHRVKELPALLFPNQIFSEGLELANIAGPRQRVRTQWIDRKSVV